MTLSLSQTSHTPLPSHYDTRFINCSTDLKLFSSTIYDQPSARICLYGPLGTGKIANGQWIAKQLDKPLPNKKCSDIQSMWVGEAEKNLSRAFEQATQDRVVLMK